MKPSGKSPSPNRVRLAAGKVRNSRSYSNIDRDNIGLEAYALNIQLSDANDRNSRLKAKVQRLKGELENANEFIIELNGRIKTNSSQLDSKLTRLVEELKGEVELQRTEIDSLRKKMRVTQYVELESEKQVYLRECLRLRKLLEKALGLKPLNAPPEASNECSLLEALKTELSRYKRSPADKMNKVRVSPNYSPDKSQVNPAKAQVTPSPVKALVTPAKAQAAPVKVQVTPVKAQVTPGPAKAQATSSPVNSQVTPSTSPVKAHSNPNSSAVKAKVNMREESSSYDARPRARDSGEDRHALSVGEEKAIPSSPDVHSYISDLQRQLSRARKDLQAVLCAFSPQDLISADELYNQLIFAGLTISAKVVNSMWKTLFPTPKVKVAQILSALGGAKSSSDAVHSLFDLDLQGRRSKSEFSISLKPVDSQDIMQQVALRMQMHRMTSEQAAQLLFDASNASPSAQQTMLINEPFEFQDEEDRRKLTEVLQSSLRLHELAELVGTWRVLEDTEEEQFDILLAQMIMGKQARFLTTCQLYDQERTGRISLSAFFAAAKVSGLDLEPRVKLYIKLLSYSYEQQLDSAPYSSLIEAFAKGKNPEDMDSLEEISEAEQEQIVTKLLRSVVTHLKSGHTLASVFNAKRGLITPEGLLEGLNSLLVAKVHKQEFLVLLATLQSDSYEDPVIELSDFEAILKEVQDAFPDYRPKPSKLVSLLDSSLEEDSTTR
jgi:hypothetical protein